MDIASMIFDVVTVLIGLMCLVIAIQFYRGKWGTIIAGYSLLTDEEKQQIDLAASARHYAPLFFSGAAFSFSLAFRDWLARVAYLDVIAIGLSTIVFVVLSIKVLIDIAKEGF